MDKRTVTSSRAKEIFRSSLRDKGLRNTRQREVILDAFLSAERHITEEEPFAMIKKTLR